MLDIDELIDRLNDEENTAVSIFNLDTNSFVFRNKTHSEIIEEYGTAEEFFEVLFAQGHKRLRLNLKSNNGNGYEADGEPLEVNFSASPQQPIPQKQETMHDAFSNSFGLGTLDVMNLMVAKNDANRLFTENEVLKSENKEHKKLIEELKEERLQTKYSSDQSKGTQEILMGAINQLPTIVSFVKGTPPVGLNASADTYTSEVKQGFAKALHHIDDAIITALDSINTGLNSNTEFSNELATLLKKYELWEV